MPALDQQLVRADNALSAETITLIDDRAEHAVEARLYVLEPH